MGCLICLSQQCMLHFSTGTLMVVPRPTAARHTSERLRFSARRDCHNSLRGLKYISCSVSQTWGINNKLHLSGKK